MSKHTAATSSPPVEFEPEFIAVLKDLFENKIVFNKVLGLKIEDIRPERVTARIDMKADLIGHYQHGRVHGGVVSAALDAMGGLACIAANGARHMTEEPMQRLQRFTKLGTIDLRIDYLRPCVGDYFLLSAEVLRLGSRVANTRMAFEGADGKLLCVGAGAYIVS
ncbi:MAG: thioesterase family protein [Hydrogenophaga sp.]|uniref:thioesterase family protein n=1 Tax=Hydrogenophaga sp. TaxID=1904254 RepID=UPI0025C51DD5|nr:thioesterase family protein [Hydrogenophaga sp.]MBU7571838.1 thioesterase family protein [Hydrogenophaga sp.]